MSSEDKLGLDKNKLIAKLHDVFGDVTPTQLALVGSFADQTYDEESDVDICWTANANCASNTLADSIPIWDTDGNFLGVRTLELFRPSEMKEADVKSFEDALGYFPEAIELNPEDVSSEDATEQLREFIKTTPGINMVDERTVHREREGSK